MLRGLGLDALSSTPRGDSANALDLELAIRSTIKASTDDIEALF
jgi:hypothetical protein